MTSDERALNILIKLFKRNRSNNSNLDDGSILLMSKIQGKQFCIDTLKRHQELIGEITESDESAIDYWVSVKNDLNGINLKRLMV